jgi:hypothetical protein
MDMDSFRLVARIPNVLSSVSLTYDIGSNIIRSLGMEEVSLLVLPKFWGNVVLVREFKDSIS